jgi:S-adenosylmethionine decarboxylase proenzyme
LDPRSRHLLVEYHGCNRALLNDLHAIEALMRVAAEAAGVTIVASAFRPFTPQGVSGVVVIEESHLSIHTWPEHGYASVDFYTCGAGTPERAHEALRASLEATHAEVLLIERGLYPSVPAMRVLAHRAEGIDLRAEDASAPPASSSTLPASCEATPREGQAGIPLDVTLDARPAEDDER